METCPKCGSLLQTGESKMTFENDTTPDLPTIAYYEIPLFCRNKNCEKYEYLIDVVRNKVN